MAKNTAGRAVVQGQLYSIGGTNLGTFDGLNDVSKYDPATNTWSPVPTLIAARSFTASVAVGNTVIAAGGRVNAKTGLASVEKLVLAGPPPLHRLRRHRRLHRRLHRHLRHHLRRPEPPNNDFVERRRALGERNDRRHQDRLRR